MSENSVSVLSVPSVSSPDLAFNSMQALISSIFNERERERERERDGYGLELLEPVR